jgi:general secretion pathway protein L
VRIDTLLKRWIELLAALLVGLQELRRARRALVVARTDQGFVVREGKPNNGSAEAATGSRLSAEIVREARGQFVTLELPADEIVVRRINIPAQAREFAAGIVQNQIERISPWQGDQVAYGFAVEASPGDAATLEARILMTARAILDAAREELGAAGLAADRIVARARAEPSGAAITLWSRLGSASDTGLAGPRRLIAAALIGVLGVSIILSTWALVSAASIRTETDDVSARAAALQRQARGARTPSASLDPAQRAWVLKDTTPAMVTVLETLSQALPDAAYVTELSLQKTIVRIVGLSSDAPSLLAPLENSGLLADVHFFAPTTRSPDGTQFLYHIEARIEPRLAHQEN